MFAKSVIGSARFLRMPSTSRLLYYDLGMQADDDGVVEAFSVMRTTGATEDDLRVLASKGFISVLNDDLVTYITDWNINNQLRKDRYHPSIYSELLVRLTSGNQAATEWQPSGNQMETEVSIGKDSIVKDNKESDKPLALSSAADEDFQKFWSAYPKKVGKQTAKKAFQKADVPMDVLLTALDQQKQLAQWKKDGGQYIPNPATWLNQRRWEDEITTGGDAGGDPFKQYF